MCFNPAKTWQLGWFANTGETTTFTSTNGSVTYTLVGASRTNAQANKFVVVKIPNGSTDIYVGYNRATGSNSGTVEDANKVLLISRSAGTGFAPSSKVGKLSTGGGTYTITNYLQRGGDLNIRFTFQQTSEGDSIGAAVVDFYYNGFAPPTPAPTPFCGNQAKMEITIQTDQYGDETTWTLRRDGLSPTVVQSGGPYASSPNTLVRLV
jgi:hypothetical protein